MKKIIAIWVLLFVLSAQALALDQKTIVIKVTINKAPEIGTFVPGDGYVITESDTLEISIDASDANNDTLKYQYYINGSIKEPWSTESSYSYALTKDDIGSNKIKAEVTDGLETVSTEEVEVYVFRKSLNYYLMLLRLIESCLCSKIRIPMN